MTQLRPARRLSFANSASRAFLLTVAAFVLTPAFVTDRPRFGVFAAGAGSSDRDGGEPPAAR